MRRRTLTAAALAVLAAVSLTACGDSKAGAAAVVDGHRITESEVADQVSPGAQPIQTRQGTTVTPKGVVLETLIMSEVLPKALAAHNGPATPEETAEVRNQLLQGGPESAVTDSLVESGFEPSFGPLYVRTQVAYFVLAGRLQAQQASDVAAALSALDTQISVNPRYGQWDAQQFRLVSTPGVSVPSFVKLAPLGTASIVPGT